MIKFKVTLKAKKGVEPEFIEDIVKAVDKTDARNKINSGRFQYLYDIFKIEKL